jgi:hypothetical protein
VENIKGKSCFCVGDKTKAVLESNGFTVLESGPNASELAQKIRSGHRDKSFTFFAGNLRLETLPLSLKISGSQFQRNRSLRNGFASAQDQRQLRRNPVFQPVRRRKLHKIELDRKPRLLLHWSDDSKGARSQDQ